MEFHDLLKLAANNQKHAEKQLPKIKRYSTNLPPKKIQRRKVNHAAIKAKLAQQEKERKDKEAEEAARKLELVKKKAEEEAAKCKKIPKQSIPDRSSVPSSSSRSEASHSKPKSSAKYDNYCDVFHQKRSSSAEKKIHKKDSKFNQKKEPLLANNQPMKNEVKIQKGPVSFHDLMKIAKEKQTATLTQEKKTPVELTLEAANSREEEEKYDLEYRREVFRQLSIHPSKYRKMDSRLDYLKSRQEKRQSRRTEDKVPSGDSGSDSEPDNRGQYAHLEKQLSKKLQSKTDSHKGRIVSNGRLSQSVSKGQVELKGQSGKGHNRDGIAMNKKGDFQEKKRPVSGSQNSVSNSKHPSAIEKKSTEYKSNNIPKKSKPASNSSFSRSDLSSKSRPQGQKSATGTVNVQKTPESKSLSNSTTHSTKNELSTPRKGNPAKQGKAVPSQKVISSKQSVPFKRPHPESTEKPGGWLGPARESGGGWLGPAHEENSGWLGPVAKPGKGGQEMYSDEEEEEDSDMDDFIDDTPFEGENKNVSSYIKDIFGYDKNKYGYESDFALKNMEASYSQIMKEESRSERLAMQEDLEEMRKEKEEEKRKKAKMAAKTGAKKQKR